MGLSDGIQEFDGIEDDDGLLGGGKKQAAPQVSCVIVFMMAITSLTVQLVSPSKSAVHIVKDAVHHLRRRWSATVGAGLPRSQDADTDVRHVECEACRTRADVECQRRHHSVKIG